MIKLDKNKIREVYKILNTDMKCYYNLKTEELLEIPDFESNPYAGEEMWQDVIEKLESDFDNFIEFDKTPSKEEYQIMVDFVDNIDDKFIQAHMIRVLNMPKPFKNFKFEFHNTAADYRIKWFEFKAQKYCEWIERYINGLNESYRGS